MKINVRAQKIGFDAGTPDCQEIETFVIEGHDEHNPSHSWNVCFEVPKKLDAETIADSFNCALNSLILSMEKQK